MVDFALWYAENGYRAFPLSPGTKIPLLSKEQGGNGCYDATTDPNQIRRWWNRCPNANIGLSTGFQFDVLDVDPDHDGEESLMKRPPIQTTVEVATPRGGSHIFFKPSPTPLKNGVAVDNGLDIRASGGYVVAAPSSIKGVGKYRWKGAMLGYAEFPDVPDWLIEIGKRSDPISVSDLFDGSLTDGKKHDQIIRSIYMMRKQGFASEIVKEIVAQGISRILPGSLKERPEYTMKKYLREVDNCFRKYPEGELMEIPEVEVPEVAGLQAFSTVSRKNTEWLWHPYIPIGGLTLMCGNPGMGKSSLGYYLASYVSNGYAHDSLPVSDPGEVLLYCLEDDPSRVIKGRLLDCGANMEMIHNGVHDEVANPEGITAPITKEKMKAIIEAVRARPKVRLVIFDPIVEWFPPDKSFNTGNEARSILTMFRKLAEECKVAVILIGHPNKSSGSSLMYRPAGSLDFSAVVRSGLYAIEDDSGHRMFKHYKANWSFQGPPIYYDISPMGIFNIVDSPQDHTKPLPKKPSDSDELEGEDLQDYLSSVYRGGD